MRNKGRVTQAIRIIATTCLTGALCFMLVSCREEKTPSINPDAVGLCDEGTADLQAFRFQDAADKLGHCLELDPSLAEAAISRAYAFVSMHDRKSYRYELARADSLTGAIKNEHRRMLAQLRLSRIPSSRYHMMGDSLRDRMQRQDPDNFYVLEALAEHADARGQSEKAISIWLRVVAINPNYAAAYNKLGYLELGRGGYDDALDYLQKYIFLAPDLANPHDSYGEGLMTIGRYEEAEKEFRTSLKMQPSFYPSLIHLGQVYLARGKIAKGTAIFNKIRERIAGTDAERRVELQIITSYAANDLSDKHYDICRSYINDYPADPITPLLRGLVLSGVGQYKQSVAVMDSTLAARRGSHQYKLSGEAKAATEMFASQYEGFKYDRLGNTEAAVASWAKAIDLLGGNTPYYEQFFHRGRLAASHLNNGQPQKALQEIDAMLAVNPRIIAMLTLKVQAHLDLNEKDQATTALEQLQWALSGADNDYSHRRKAEELSIKIDSLALR